MYNEGVVFMDKNTNNIIDNNDNGIDIYNILISLWKKKWLIISLALAFAAFFCIKSMFFSTPLYQSNGILYIRTFSDEVAEQEEYIYASDINTARNLTSTYTQILLTRSFLTDVSKEVGEKYNWREIRSMISVSALDETELLSVVVTSSDPDDAYLIAKAILDKAPEKFESILNGGGIHIIDDAVYNDVPISRGTTRKTAMGFLMGAVLGIVISVILDMFDRKIHSGRDISKKYDISILGEIPQGIPAKHKRNKTGDNSSGAGNILNDETPFATVETYKAIRTNVMFSIPKNDMGKVIVVTGSAQSEGKTTTTTNLAITFSQTGAKVILVDCDLRKPRIHRYMQMSKSNGLSNVLCGFSELDDAIQKSKYENLDVLVAGEIPSNPAELLNSDLFATLLNELKSKYDYVFIDTPPLTIVTDAAVIMQKSNGVIVVARENYTTYDLLDASMEKINDLKTKIFGVIVVDSTENKKKYSYYKLGKYGYKYGYKYLYQYKYGDDA